MLNEAVPKQASEAPAVSAENWLIISVLGVVWGSSFLLTELALKGITPLWLAAGRVVIAALLTTFVWGLYGWRLHLSTERHWGTLFFFGLLSATLPFQFLSWGQQHVTSAFAGVSMASVGLIILPLAHIMLPNEKITLSRFLGLLVGFVGILILFGQQSFTSTDDPLETLGRVACLLAAMCYALSSVLLKRLPPIDRIGVAALPLIMGAFLIVANAWVFEGAPPAVDFNTAMIILLLAAFPTALANLLRIKVIRSAGPVFMSLVSYLVPVWCVVLGVFVLGETMTPSLIIALVVILGGIAVTQWDELRRLINKSRNAIK